MSGWVKCTKNDGTTIYANLDIAISVYRNEKDTSTTIAYPGDDDDIVMIVETPEDILLGKRFQRASS